jgi:serine/threonine protein kinase
MAPEQTRRTGLSVDYRTDFYSLGATFYHLLAGMPPFMVFDGGPLDLVYAHIARKQKPLAKLALFHGTNKIPKAISDIVDKLMSKHPDDRYQSAYGLKKDLEACLEEVQKHGSLSKDFRIDVGKYDMPDIFCLPQKLYGRTDEIKKLQEAFFHVVSGGSAVTTISGSPGVGKTALVSTIQNEIIKLGNGSFCKGKWDPFVKDVPYSGIVQCIRQLLLQKFAKGKDGLLSTR